MFSKQANNKPGLCFVVLGYHAAISVIYNRRFGTIYRAHFQGSRIQKEGTDRLYLNTSVRNHHCPLRDNPKESSSRLHYSYCSVPSTIAVTFLVELSCNLLVVCYIHALLIQTLKFVAARSSETLVPNDKITRCHKPNTHRRENYLLTQWCRVLLEKLTGLQLVKKFHAFQGPRGFITALTSVRHLSLSWASPIQSTYPHPTSWRSVLILSTHLCLGLPSCLFPSGFPTKNLYTPLSSTIRATCPAHLILLDFITRTILGEEYKSFSSSLCNLLHSPASLSLLGPNILLNTIFSTPSASFPPSMSAIKFYTHTNQPAKLCFYIS